ncbi:MAG: ATP-dependent RecD-like DNA helicase [Clostridia bacterium]|nr:ATP-dependent RecD-like DNA helicase [Clostridia bacterium]
MDTVKPMGTEKDTVKGIVDSIVYRNEENGYTVCMLEDSDGLPITVVGIMPYINEGDSLCATGMWTTHKIYGRQFNAETFDRSLPAEEGDILRYLASGAVKGIGPKTAQKIVEKFGTDSFDVIENNPEWLASIQGISRQKAKEMSENFRNISGSREFMMFSRDFFPSATAMRIYKKWGGVAIDRIRNNPYSLCSAFRGIGFKRADVIAATVGLPRDSSARVEAGILHVLSTEAVRNGHTCLPYDTLVECALGLLFGMDVSCKEKLTEKIDEMCEGNRLFCVTTPDGRFVYHPHIYEAETYVARKLCELDRLCPSLDERDIELLIDKSEAYSRIRYAPMQRKAIVGSLSGGVMVLTGGPGTGKTTIVKGLLHIFESLDYSVSLAAPTGRAAKRMSEATSHEAKTIHRLLEMEYSGDETEAKFLRNRSNPIEEKVIIIDEASMIDIVLMEALLCAVRGGTKLILIGDGDQLPSVGCGAVLGDVISSGAFRVVCLNEVFRQAETSSIITNAHRINMGLMPEVSSKGTDFFFLERRSDEATAQTVVELVTKRLPKTYGANIVNRLQIITPSRKGAAGTESLNAMLQAAMNPAAKGRQEKRSRNIVFRAGDRVMQTKNNYQTEWSTTYGDTGFGVFNGDIGVIETIDTENEIITVNFDDKRCEYDYSMLEELEHAYAITVHKSQGSEYPVVIIPVYHCAPMLQSRNLLYTAVTRASGMVIIVGDRQVLRNMVENDYQADRCTMLASLISREMN